MERSNRQVRIAENQTRFRRVNEAREPAEGVALQVAGYVCECGRLSCTDTIALRREQYEAVRSSFDRFLVVPGHEVEGVDEVVEDHGAYHVVVKVGEAREVAAADEDQTGDEEVAGR